MVEIKNCYLLLICLIFFFSCSQKQERGRPNTFSPKVIVSDGYLVPPDSVTEPKVIPAGKPAIVKAGNPKVVPTNANVVLAGEPKIVLQGQARVCTPGQDTFLLPKSIVAVDSPFAAGIPEVVIAKDAYVKDQNPQGFSSFSKLQGLKHDVIKSILQDNSGGLWFATNGGGVSKYDGKFFTHFTEATGLSDNTVFCMLIDKGGNLWFGTNGGVSKYDGKSFTNFTEEGGLSNNTVLSMLEDDNGNLWFGTYGGGVTKYDGRTFMHYSEKEGLSNNVVWSMLKDKKGNLWFGTDVGGVSKYNGKSFTHLTKDQGLSDNTVLSILEDKGGNLWFGTSEGGLSKYDGKRFAHFTEKEGLSSNTVRSILEDTRGQLWFGTDGGLNKYDGKSIAHYTETEGLANNTVFAMLVDKGGNFWLGTHGGGVCKFDGKSFTHLSEKEGLSNNGVWSILEDKGGNLWFGTNGGGVSKYDGKFITHFTEKEGLSNNSVFSILEDNGGNLWFGTFGGGVTRYDGKVFTYFTEKEGLSSNIIRSMFEDKNGNLWFGTNGGGVCKYDGNRVEAIEAALQRGETIPERLQQGLKMESGKFVKSFTHFTVREGLSDNTVWSILEDKDGNLWFATFGGVCKYDGNRVEEVEAALKRGEPISERKQRGLKKENGKFVKSFTRFSQKEGLSNNIVLSMLEDESGCLWFGTYGGGLSKYDGRSFVHFTEKEGLTNNTVLSMLQDKSGNLWFGSRFGLSKLSPKSKRDLFFYTDNADAARDAEGKIFFKNYTYEDGFLGIGVNGGKTICEDKSGTIWIAANDRLTAFHPEGEIRDTIAPNVQLTSITLFNENVSWSNLIKSKSGTRNYENQDFAMDTSIVLGNGVSISDFEFDGLTKWYNLPENLSLAYNNNYVTFNFIGITMAQPKRVKYQYKLEGIDENWSAIASRTEAPYGNLPHGSYTFKVKAMNSEGYWSNESTYTFTIRPPWWKTWWFRTSVGVLVIASIWYYIKSRERKLVAEKEMLEKTVVERTAQVVEQKHIIEEKHKEITDSINYAERIQRSFLATKELLDSNFADYFVFFQPKDVVSGDFYWGAKLENENFVLVTADSTGHGVPGAIMSILNISCLEKSVEEEALTEPNAILNHTRLKIIERLKKDEVLRVEKMEVLRV